MIPVNGMLEWFKPHGTSREWRTSPGPKQVPLQLRVSAGSGLETGRREFASFRGSLALNSGGRQPAGGSVTGSQCDSTRAPSSLRVRARTDGKLQGQVGRPPTVSSSSLTRKPLPTCPFLPGCGGLQVSPCSWVCSLEPVVGVQGREEPRVRGAKKLGHAPPPPPPPPRRPLVPPPPWLMKAAGPSHS